MLSVCSNQIIPSDGSSKLILFDCSCGRKNVLKKWKYFISGETNSCGKCNFLEKEHWENTKYGKLKMKNPKDTSNGSGRIVEWICDCGKEIDYKQERELGDFLASEIDVYGDYNFDWNNNGSN